MAKEKEPTLYDFEQSEEVIAEEATTANGTSPEYVETTDEEELRSLIFQTSDVQEQLLPVPEWKVNGKVVRVLVRGLNAYERGQFIMNMQKANFDLTKVYPDIVILTARHPVTKKLLFKPADRGELNKKLGAAVERIAMCASELSGLTQEFLMSMKKN
jgi:hypothetical protein